MWRSSRPSGPWVVARALDAVPLAKSRLEDVRSRLEDARSRLEDARSRLEDARSHLEDARSHLEDAGSRLEDAGSRLEDAGSRLKDAGSRLEDARSRLEDARSRLEDAGSRLKDARSCLEDARSRLEDTGFLSRRHARTLPAELRRKTRYFKKSVAKTALGIFQGVGLETHGRGINLPCRPMEKGSARKEIATWTASTFSAWWAGRRLLQPSSDSR